jgi:hypothetical protein
MMGRLLMLGGKTEGGGGEIQSESLAVVVVVVVVVRWNRYPQERLADRKCNALESEEPEDQNKEGPGPKRVAGGGLPLYLSWRYGRHQRG